MKYINSIIKLILILLVLANISGCAFKRGDNFTSIKAPIEDKSTIYIYRPWAFTGSAGLLGVFDSGIKLTPMLSPESYMVYITEPGKHKIHSDVYGAVDHDLFLITEPGKAYFVRMLIQNNFFYHAIKAEQVDKETALEELKNYKIALPDDDSMVIPEG